MRSVTFLREEGLLFGDSLVRVSVGTAEWDEQVAEAFSEFIEE